MSAVVGVDLSSKAIDLVKLDEESNRAEWVRVELVGAKAWERTLSIRDGMLPANLPGFGPPLAYTFDDDSRGSFWEDVYLVAIEAPMGYGSNALDRVVGAIAASLPAALRRPERCWIVQPQEWKAGLGLKGKPTHEDLSVVAPGWSLGCQPLNDGSGWMTIDQNARDAYCIAMWARDENAKGIAA